MKFVIPIAVSVLVIIIVIAAFIAMYSSHSKYFGSTCQETQFYTKKHTQFRLFGIMYCILHYLLSITATIFTLITVYMVLDKNIDTKQQVFFLLMAAILSTLSQTIHFNEIAKVYFEAMTIMETGILNYYKDKNDEILIQANKDAERIIREKYM